LVLLGGGVVAGVLLKRSKAEGSRLDSHHRRVVWSAETSSGQKYPSESAG
jgi:hypothetical protein